MKEAAAQVDAEIALEIAAYDARVDVLIAKTEAAIDAVPNAKTLVELDALDALASDLQAESGTLQDEMDDAFDDELEEVPKLIEAWNVAYGGAQWCSDNWNTVASDVAKRRVALTTQ